MAPEEAGKSKFMSRLPGPVRWWLRILGWGLGLSICEVFLLGGLGPVSILTSSFLLVSFGWALHLGRTLPSVAVDPGAVLFGVASWLVFLAAAHLFLGSWMRSRGRAWDRRRALGASALPFLVFGIAVVSAGIFGQVAQLASIEQWTKNTWDSPTTRLRTACAQLRAYPASPDDAPEMVHAKASAQVARALDEFELFTLTSTSTSHLLLVPRDRSQLKDGYCLDGVREDSGDWSDLEARIRSGRVP